MPADGKYARVYFTIEEDERFRDVFHDARHLGTWLQLLLVAEAMYPTAAPIPAYISKPSLKVLVDAGIIELHPHQHYKVHGLAAEREKRSERARNAAALRWHSDSNATPMLVRERERERERADTREHSADVDLDAWQVLSLKADELTGMSYCLSGPYGKMGTKVLGQASMFGVPAVITAWEKVASLHDPRPTVRQLVFEAEDLIAPIDHGADRRQREEREAEADRERIAAKNARYQIVGGDA